MRGYTYHGEATDEVARARGIELPMSPKKTYEVMNAIRGLGLEKAKVLLEDVIEERRAIPFRRYNQETAHKTGIGPGRYPKKVARSVLQILKNAEANAEYEGIDTDDLVVRVAACARGRIRKANMPRAHGRATAWNEQTTNVEIVLAERGAEAMASERKVIQEATRRVLLKDYLVQESARAGFGGLDIQRTPMGTRVTLICERPGILIGRRGELIKQLTQDIKDRFDLDNPQIEVQEERQPSLNAQLMAEKLASTLERGWHFRRAGHSTVRRIMESGARGCQVILSGKLTGERHRTERFKSGTIKYCGEAVHLWMGKGFYQARLKPGVIGVTVWIMKPTAKLPDEIHVKDVPAPVIAPPPDVLPPVEGDPLAPIPDPGVPGGPL